MSRQTRPSSDIKTTSDNPEGVVFAFSSIAAMFQNACVLALCFIAVNAGLIPLESAKYLEGPSSNTKVFGPDGSIIDAYAPGGRVLLDGHSGPLLQTAPVVYAHPSIAGFEFQHLVVPESVSNAVEARESAPAKEETEETTSYTTELPATTEEVQTSTPDVSGVYVPVNLEQLYDDGSINPNITKCCNWRLT